MKLARMANSGNENEAEVAQNKLDQLASQFGLTGEEAQTKAEDMLGLNVEPLSVMDQAIQASVQPYRKLPKDTLVDALLHCFIRHPHLYDELNEKFL